MLDQKQSNWILKKLSRFLSRNLDPYPETEEDWKLVFADAKQLAEETKENQDCRNLILEAIGFLENVGKLNVLSQETKQEKP